MFFKRSPLNERPRCFFDIEATGLEIGYNECIEIAFIHDLLGPWQTKIKPKYPDRFHPRAIEVTGYKEYLWRDAPSFEDVHPKIMEFMSDCILIGHNALRFDIPMIEAECRMKGLESSPITHSCQDTQAMALDHLMPRGLKRLSLNAVCDFLEIPYENAHTAYADALMAKKVYERMSKRQTSLF
jgi:DNA polymerase-3 subunit alpha (Gram-positive type)